MRLFVPIIFVFFLSVIATISPAAAQAVQMVYVGNVAALISTPPGWTYVPAEPYDKDGILAFYKINKMSLNDAQIVVQMRPQKSKKNELDIQIGIDKKVNGTSGGKFVESQFLTTNAGVSASINLWSYPTNNNFIGIVPSEKSLVIIGGFSMHKKFDKNTRKAVEHIVKNIKFMDKI